jgi:hypothetical protein
MSFVDKEKWRSAMQFDTMQTVDFLNNQPHNIYDGDKFVELITNTKISVINLSSLTKEICKASKKSDEYWYVIGSRLKRISKERMYRLGGYRSFSDYCRNVLGYSRQHSYKLMKVVDFIDEKWEKAQSFEDREMVKRLFNLGFTKLFLIHSIPSDTLNQILNEGVKIKSEDGEIINTLNIEEATAGQIKAAGSNKKEIESRHASLAD